MTDSETRSHTTEWTALTPELLARMAEMSGIEFLRAMLAGELPRPPMSATLGFDLVAVEPGKAEFRATPGEHVYNPIGMVHGGYAMTLIDSAAGVAIQSMAPPGKRYTTLETKVNMVRTILADTGELRCIGEIIHFGTRTATAEARLYAADDQLYAHGTTTCLLVDIK